MTIPLLYLFCGLAFLSLSFFLTHYFVFFSFLLALFCLILYLRFRADYTLRIFLLFLTFSFVCFSFLLQHHSLQQVVSQEFLGKKSIVAIVKSLPRIYEDDVNKSIFFLASAKQIIFFDEKTKKHLSVDEDIYVMLFQADQIPVLGDEILLYGDIKAMPQKMNRFEKDYLRQWRNKNVHFVLTGYGRNALEILRKKSKLMYFLRDVQDQVGLKITKLWGNSIQNNYFNALLLGRKQNIHEDDRKAFARAGVAHILVVSGLHVTLVASFMLFFLFIVGYGNNIAVLLTTIFIVIYAMMSNLGVPILRASMMSILILMSYSLKRGAQTLNLLFLAAVVLLIFDPTVLFNVAFLLSFLSVLAITLNHAFSFRVFVDPRFLNGLSLFSMVKKTAVIMLFTLPVLAVFFHEIAWIGLLTNILVIPCFSLAIFFAFFALCADWTGLFSSIAADIAGGIVGYTRLVVIYFSKLPFSVIPLYSPSHNQIMFYYLCLLFVFYSYRHLQLPVFKKLFQLSSCALFYMVMLLVISPKPFGMRFNFFSAQENFSCLLDFGHDQKWVINYQRGRSKKQIDRILEDFSKARRIDKITGLLTSESFLNRKRLNQKSKLFTYIISTNQKFEGQGIMHSKIGVNDQVMLRSNKISIKNLAVKDNEAIWYIYGNKTSSLIIPFFDIEIFHKISVDLVDIDLIVYVPEQVPSRAELNALQEIFNPNQLIVNKLPNSQSFQIWDGHNIFSLDRDGEITVKIKDGFYTFHPLNSLKIRSVGNL